MAKNKSAKYDVLCIGDATIDITLSVPNVPGSDDKVIGKKISEQVGGTAANCACVCGSLGLKVATFSNAGEDKQGQRILAEFSHYGVATEYMTKVKDLEPFSVIAMLDKSGEKSMVILPSEPPPYSQDLLKKAIHNSRYIYTMPGDIELLQLIGELSHKANRKLVVDIEPTTFSSKQELEQILLLADIVIFNKAGYYKAFDANVSRYSLEQMVLKYSLKGICVTLGKEGSVALVHGEYACRSAFNVPVIDTTGAGDTFNATLLHGIVNNYDINKTLRYATASAAISIGAIGAKGCIPSHQDIDLFLANNKISQL